MISTEQLLYKLEQRLNKLSSSQFQSISKEDRILVLNESQLKLIKKKLNKNNPEQEGYDSMKKRYEDLQILVVPFENLPVTKTNDIHTSYQGDITQLSQKYFVPLDMYCLATRGNCKKHPIYIQRVARHGDLFSLMFNTNYAPSFNYQETLCLISGNNIIVYSNDLDGDFIVTDLFVEYLRYPQEMDIAGYTKLDGTQSTNSDCELVDYLEDELLDIAVMQLAMNTGNDNVMQGAAYNLKTNE